MNHRNRRTTFIPTTHRARTLTALAAFLLRIAQKSNGARS